MDVFVVQHGHEFEDGREDVKFIGVYSTAELARQAVRRLGEQPGFRGTIEGFHVDQYRLDEDHWREGYKAV